MTTWIDYLNDIKYFFRWLYNNKKKTDDEDKENGEMASSSSEWKKPPFARIKKKKTKRLSPHLETQLWEHDELLFINRYEPFKRNKPALALFLDLNARNHEVTLLKIMHIRLREKYAEGEIPHQAKTGCGPILHISAESDFLTMYIRGEP